MPITNVCTVNTCSSSSNSTYSSERRRVLPVRVLQYCTFQFIGLSYSLELLSSRPSERTAFDFWPSAPANPVAAEPGPSAESVPVVIERINKASSPIVFLPPMAGSVAGPSRSHVPIPSAATTPDISEVSQYLTAYKTVVPRHCRSCQHNHRRCLIAHLIPLRTTCRMILRTADCCRLWSGNRGVGGLLRLRRRHQ